MKLRYWIYCVGVGIRLAMYIILALIACVLAIVPALILIIIEWDMPRMNEKRYNLKEKAYNKGKK